MAKLLHLKELIEFETGASFLNSVEEFTGLKVEAKLAQPSIGSRLPPDVTIWDAAMRLEIPVTEKL